MRRNNDKPVSKQALYSMVSSRAKGVILRLIELTKSQNESVALGACKTLLNKTLPDIRTIAFEQIPADCNRPEPKSDNELNLDAMTQAEIMEYGNGIIDAAQAIMGVGKYAPYEYKDGRMIKVEQ
jgi:hypothetical protein